jgi:hypothetical protein
VRLRPPLATEPHFPAPNEDKSRRNHPVHWNSRSRFVSLGGMRNQTRLPGYTVVPFEETQNQVGDTDWSTTSPQKEVGKNERIQ